MSPFGVPLEIAGDPNRHAFFLSCAFVDAALSEKPAGKEANSPVGEEDNANSNRKRQKARCVGNRWGAHCSDTDAEERAAILDTDAEERAAILEYDA